jgi:hypothetical protein
VPFRTIDDLYIEGTRLRLRSIVDSRGERHFKLGKKYGKRSAHAEPITTLYLEEPEYLQLASLAGNRVSKRRFAIAGGSLDLYLPMDAVAIFEREFPSATAAAAYDPPAFVTREVSGDPAFSGAALARRRSAAPRVT